jgi:hypothetical protein
MLGKLALCASVVALATAVQSLRATASTTRASLRYAIVNARGTKIHRRRLRAAQIIALKQKEKHDVT